MKVTLTMVKADGTRRDFPLSKERTVVGRTNTCDLRVPLPNVSRQHCEILMADGAVKLRDLGSSNGTFHNNSRVQEATLATGDEISVGSVVFRLKIEESSESTSGGIPSGLGGTSKVLRSGTGASTAPLSRPAPKSAPEEDDVLPLAEIDDPIAALEGGQPGPKKKVEDLDELSIELDDDI